jgi:hypothetical protein
VAISFIQSLASASGNSSSPQRVMSVPGASRKIVMIGICTNASTLTVPADTFVDGNSWDAKIINAAHASTDTNIYAYSKTTGSPSGGGSTVSLTISSSSPWAIWTCELDGVDLNSSLVGVAVSANGFGGTMSAGSIDTTAGSGNAIWISCASDNNSSFTAGGSFTAATTETGGPNPTNVQYLIAADANQSTAWGGSHTGWNAIAFAFRQASAAANRPVKMAGEWGGYAGVGGGFAG